MDEFQLHQLALLLQLSMYVFRLNNMHSQPRIQGTPSAPHYYIRGANW